MPKLETVGGLRNGDKVTIGKHRSGVCQPGEEATVSWCYNGDDGSGEWVYVTFSTKRFFHAACKTPCFGPFAFRADDLSVVTQNP